MAADRIHHAADRIAAVEQGRRALYNFNTFYRQRIDRFRMVARL
jgi:hypothetical protein